MLLFSGVIFEAVDDMTDELCDDRQYLAIKLLIWEILVDEAEIEIADVLMLHFFIFMPEVYVVERGQELLDAHFGLFIVLEVEFEIDYCEDYFCV